MSPDDLPDLDVKDATKLLRAIGHIYNKLDGFAARLRRRSGVKWASVFQFSPRKGCFGQWHSDGTFTRFSGSDFGVSAGLQDGSCVDWWIELGWSAERWYLEYNVHKHDPDEDGSHIAVAFQVRYPATLDEVIDRLNAGLEELIATAESDELFN